MPQYGALEDKPGDTLGYYQRERTCSFLTQRILLGITAVLFILLGLAAVIVVLFFDVFLLSLWPNLFYSVIGFAVGLIVAGSTGTLAVHTRSTAALLLFAFFAVCMIGASATMLVFTFTESTNPDLPSIESQWAQGIEEGGRQLMKLCDLQRDLGCQGWDESCAVDPPTTPSPTSGVTSDSGSSSAAAGGGSGSLFQSPGVGEVEEILRKVKGHSAHSLVSNPYLFAPAPNSTNGTNTTNHTTPAPTGVPANGTDAPSNATLAPGTRRLCPVCSSAPQTSQTCRPKIRATVDDAAPVIATVAIFMCLLLFGMLFWSWKIRRRSRRVQEEEQSMVSPSRYL